MHCAGTALGLVLAICATGAALGQTIIVDDVEPGFTVLTGTWNSGAYGSPYGAGYRWANGTGTASPSAEVEWRPDLPLPGDCEVAVHYVSGPNRAVDAPFTVYHAQGATTVLVDQQHNTSTWVPLGSFAFDAGASGFVRLSNAAGPGVVIADAVRFRRLDGLQLVPGGHPAIAIDGALFPSVGDYAVRLDRIDPLLLAAPGGLFAPTVAVLTTGVTIRFRTDSLTVRANFNHLSYVVTRGTGYVVFQDGLFDRLVHDLEVVEFASWQPGLPVTFEIVCPSYDEVTLGDLELEPGAALFALPADHRRRYFALGDSITHGSELDADTKADSTTAYPWVLAAARGWRLYNLAVGGSKVAPAFGGMLAGQRADLISILWGVNDKSQDNDLPLFLSKYAALLDNLRAAQPWTPIHCITMTTTASDGPGSNGYTLDDYRAGLADLVAARQAAGDCHLHLVRGELLTTPADLSDGLHLSVPGAARFAGELAELLAPPWGDFDDDGAWTAADWTLLADCLAGPGMPPAGQACGGCDYDCDADVDLCELAALQIRCGP